MFARVVRFTGVTPDGVAAVVSRVEANDGPPPGVNASGMKFLHDEGNETSLFVSFFETRADMEAADEILNAMDVSNTPGTRVSVDLCEVKIERDS